MVIETSPDDPLQLDLPAAHRAALRRHADSDPRRRADERRRPRIAVCPGSYDPVTNGHLDIIDRTSNVFDRVVVGVVNQPVRKEKTLFTAEERKAFIEDATADLGNVEVEIMSNLLVEFARENGATAIIKGLRAISDFEYEFEMNQLNRKLAADIESDVHLRLRRTTASCPRRGSRRSPPSAATSAIWCRLRLQKRLRSGSPARSVVREGWAGACRSAEKRNPGPVQVGRCVSFSDCTWTF